MVTRKDDFVEKLIKGDNIVSDNNSPATSIPREIKRYTTTEGIHVEEFKTFQNGTFKLEYTDNWLKVVSNGKVLHDGPATKEVRDIYIKQANSYKKRLDDIDLEESLKIDEFHFESKSCGCCLITGLIMLIVGALIIYGLSWGGMTIFNFLKSLF